MRDLCVIGSSSGGVQIKLHVESVDRLNKLLVVPVGDYHWLNAFPFRGERGGGAMHIATGNHQHPIAAQPVVARKYVGWEEGACDVAEVRFAICIWPRDRDKN